ncbi:MAG: hypothetical protein ACE5HS_16575 [bacterium]
MHDYIHSGRGRKIIQIPRKQWEHHLSRAPQHIARRLYFMTADHHRVRYFVVRELPRIGRPIEPDFLSEQLTLPLEKIQTILDDLESHLFFLFRNKKGAVSWAYPVTVDPTPQRLTYSSGERLYAA